MTNGEPPRFKAGLIFVFNHKFERNISRLDEYYGDRFSKRKFLMPFATVDDPRVVPVIENGFTFGGHIAQGHSLYDDPDVTHYLFLGDDLILNPSLNELNLVESLGLAEGQGYIKSLAPADAIRHHWPWSIRSTLNLENAGFDFSAELPSAVEARSKFERMGLRFERPWPHTSRDARWMTVTFPHRMFKSWLYNIAWLGRSSAYPLLAGYSDFVVVPKQHVRAFAHFCGVFAAMNMFAEVGVPTALALACPSVKTELLMGHHFMDQPLQQASDTTMRGIELWGEEIESFSKPFGYQWAKFLDTFPPDALYYHPIKLSKWK